MKIRLLALLAVLPVIPALCACTQAAPQAPSEFCAQVRITGSQLPLQGEVALCDGVTVLSLSAPANVAGIRYTFADGQLTTSYGEHNAVTAHDQLPPTAAPEVLYHSLAYLSRAEHLSCDENGDAFLLNTPYGAATLVCRDGRLLSLTAEYSPYAFTFSVD